MERMGIWKCSLVVALAMLMFVSSLEISNASSVTNTTQLPGWLEKQISLFYPNASAAKLDQVRSQIIEQMEHNQKRIAETNGAVLSFTGPEGTLDTGGYMADFLYQEPWNGGIVYNPTNIEGSQLDSSYAEFYTPLQDQKAAIVGEMSSTYAGGDVYVVGKLGPNGLGRIGNVLNVWVSNSSEQYGIWLWAGNATVTVPYSWPEGYIWIGQWSGTFSYMAIGVVTGDIYHQFNDIVADCVYTTSG